MTPENCPDFLEQLDDYRFNRLSPADRARVDAHLRNCDDCRAELAFRNLLAGELEFDPVPHQPADLSLDVKNVIREQRPESARSRKSNMLPWMMAAAAVAVAGVGFIQINQSPDVAVATSADRAITIESASSKAAKSESYEVAREETSGNYALMEAQIRPEPRRQDKELDSFLADPPVMTGYSAAPMPAAAPPVIAGAPIGTPTSMPATEPARVPADSQPAGKEVLSIQAGEFAKAEYDRQPSLPLPSSPAKEIASADKAAPAKIVHSYSVEKSESFSSATNLELRAAMPSDAKTYAAPADEAKALKKSDLPPMASPAVQRDELIAGGKDSQALKNYRNLNPIIESKVGISSEDAPAMVTPSQPAGQLYSTSSVRQQVSSEYALGFKAESERASTDRALRARMSATHQAPKGRALIEDANSTETLTSGTVTSSTLQSTNTPVMEYNYP